MTSDVEAFQVSVDAAEEYEASFVPALFADWAAHLVDAAAIERGQSVLDVACGTGAVTRVAAERLAGSGQVVGLDLNDGMLGVARRLRPELEWVLGDAMNLPFEDATFDVVLCQAALMFVPDPGRAIAEMARVARPGGTVAVQVWARREAQDGFKPAYEIIARHAGPAAVDLVSAYWVMGDLGALRRLFASAALEVTGTVTRTGAIRMPSIDAYVTTEVEGTPLRDRINDETYATIRREINEAMADLVTLEGFRLPIIGHIVTAQRPPIGR
jgi:ubiquinone/menaquinone biosynthesis C-methylase UbiE